MRNYYRCADCLRIAVLEEDRAKWYNRTDMACGCGGRLEFMGTVKAGKLTKTSYETPCDDRCTGALGPYCSCHCGGANHGSQLILKVERITGSVPELELGGDSKERGLAYRELWDKALAEWKSRHGALVDRKNDGVWLSREEFSTYLDAMRDRRLLTKIGEMRVYSTRQKKLAKFYEAMRDLETGSSNLPPATTLYKHGETLNCKCMFHTVGNKE